MHPVDVARTQLGVSETPIGSNEIVGYIRVEVQ